MKFLGSIFDKLQRHPKRVVFPEGDEPRVIQAARQYYALRLGVPVLLGDRTRIKEAAAELGVSLEGVRIINPVESEDLPGFARRYERLRKLRGIMVQDSEALLSKPNYFGSMMLAMHQVDGLISGVSEVSGSVLRPLFQIVKVAPQATTASGCMVIEVQDTQFGEGGVMVLADCGVIPDPTVDQLADISISAAVLARQVMGVTPRVAFLSYATHGNPSQPSVGKMQAARALAERKAMEQRLEAEFDGDLQVDAAIIPEIAKKKLPDSSVAGRANVLVFPDLNSGNIASKLIQHIARANAYGQVLMGLDRPAAEVSRGASARDVLGVAAIVGMQSIHYEKLYPGSGHTLPGEGFEI